MGRSSPRRCASRRSRARSRARSSCPRCTHARVTAAACETLTRDPKPRPFEHTGRARQGDVPQGATPTNPTHPLAYTRAVAMAPRLFIPIPQHTPTPRLHRGPSKSKHRRKSSPRRCASKRSPHHQNSMRRTATPLRAHACCCHDNAFIFTPIPSRTLNRGTYKPAHHRRSSRRRCASRRSRTACLRARSRTSFSWGTSRCTLSRWAQGGGGNHCNDG